jgi:hypothetical protein
MNEWGGTSYETLVGVGMSATIHKFKQRCGLVVTEKKVLSLHLSS